LKDVFRRFAVGVGVGVGVWQRVTTADNLTEKEGCFIFLRGWPSFEKSVSQ
jgi:hypothetical protein